MMTIWKYRWDRSSDVATFHMPPDSEVLCAREQGEDICIWACVNPNNELRVARRFRICGTGHSVTIDDRYVGTAMLSGGALVFHVFEVCR